MTLVKYSAEQMKEKERQLRLFIRHFPIKNIHKNEGYLIYQVDKEILKVKEQANNLATKLGLTLRATICEVNKVRVG